MHTHKTGVEACNSFVGQVERATRSEDVSWLGCVWTWNNGKLTMDRTTFNFPHAEAIAACQLLLSNLERESGLDTSPLPVATGFPPPSVGSVLGESVPAGAKSDATASAVVS